MENKVLIKIIIPELDKSFDAFVPVNELVWKAKKLIIKSASEIEGIKLNINDNYVLVNKRTNEIYNDNDIIINTNIRNSTELLLINDKA